MKLRAQRVIVIAPHIGSDPKSVVEAAKAARDDRAKSDPDDPFEEVWVVFDTEGPQNVQRQAAARNAIDQARQLRFLTAVSNPSFEYWLLLHFERRVQPINDGDAACKLLKKHITNYDKSINCFDSTWPRLDNAIQNARQVFAERCVHLRNDPCVCHPCTEVYRLVEGLMKP